MEEPKAVLPKKARGFAALTPQHLAEISQMGGRTAHAIGRAHQFTPEEAREAGRKGGKTTHERRRQSSEDKRPTLRPVG
jgi:general stress protein YciG